MKIDTVDKIRSKPNFLHPMHGIIADDVQDMADKCFVIIPTFSATKKFGPCKWQARDSTSHPSRGNTCIVVLDDKKEPWVVAWWPF